MTTKHAATKLRIVVLQDVIGTTKHNKAAPGPAKPYAGVQRQGSGAATQTALTRAVARYQLSHRIRG
jgi:hypothetical protein